MISLPWLFSGVITGFLIVCVFDPPLRQIPSIPTPNDSGAFRTKTGCVSIQADVVECSPSAVSLNVIAGK